jgi:N4-gp56 family major capsid protein
MAATISATDSELQKPVNVVFEQTFLRRAQQNLPYFMGTSAGTLNKQAGTSTIKWRRIEQETPTTTALTELTGTAAYFQGRSADTPTFTDVTATVAKYGQVYIVNEEVDLFNPNGTTTQLVGVLGESAGRSLNQLQRDIGEDNATKRYAANVAAETDVESIVTTGSLNRVINELCQNSARPFTAMTNGSTNIGTAPILPSFWAICNPDVANDVAGLTGFKSIEIYAGQTMTVPGEFGYYANAGYGCRFVQTPDASINANGGGSLSGQDLKSTSAVQVDTYTILIYGQDAFGSVGLGEQHTDGVYRAGDNTGGWMLINHPKGSSGASDPFDELGTVAWKAWHAGAVLNANWSRALLVAATDLTN